MNKNILDIEYKKLKHFDVLKHITNNTICKKSIKVIKDISNREAEIIKKYF